MLSSVREAYYLEISVWCRMDAYINTFIYLERNYDMKELYEKIRDAAFTCRKNQANGIMVARQVETMKNILYNNLDGIEKALEYASKAAQEIKVLTVELQDAESELSEKARELEELKASGTKSGRKSNKTDG